MAAIQVLKAGPPPGGVYIDNQDAYYRVDRQGGLMVSELHGRYFEQSFRKNLFNAANQAAQAWTVALALPYTGLVLSNPSGSGVNLVLTQVGFALTVAPAAIASIGLFAGTGSVTHTTPVTPQATFIGSGATPKGLVDSSATLTGSPTWIMPFMGGFTAAALPATSPAVLDLGGVFVVGPNSYIGIAALTAVTGFGALNWEEVPV